MQFVDVAVKFVGVLGFALAAYTFTRDRLAGRRADIEARWVQVDGHWPGHPDRARTDHTMLLLNHGKHAARGVRVELIDQEGQPLTSAFYWDEVGAIGAGHRYGFPFSRGMCDHPRGVRVTWTDGRRGRQSTDLWTTPHPFVASEY